MKTYRCLSSILAVMYIIATLFTLHTHTDAQTNIVVKQLWLKVQLLSDLRNESVIKKSTINKTIPTSSFIFTTRQTTITIIIVFLVPFTGRQLISTYRHALFPSHSCARMCSTLTFQVNNNYNCVWLLCRWSCCMFNMKCEIFSEKKKRMNVH